jgi:hypothetical protein
MRKKALALLLATAGAFAQQNAKSPAVVSKPKAPASGVVSGRIFLITQGGDIKPARFALVSLFYYGTSVIRPMEDSAYQKLLDERLKASEERLKGSRAMTPAMDCLAHLKGFLDAASGVSDWSKTGGKSRQYISAEADEEGNFKMAAPPGVYHIQAYGHAGFNDAVWLNKHGLLDDDIEVRPGSETGLKLSSPEVACLRSE